MTPTFCATTKALDRKLGDHLADLGVARECYAFVPENDEGFWADEVCYNPRLHSAHRNVITTVWAGADYIGHVGS